MKYLNGMCFCIQINVLYKSKSRFAPYLVTVSLIKWDSVSQSVSHPADPCKNVHNCTVEWRQSVFVDNFSKWYPTCCEQQTLKWRNEGKG